MTRQEALEEFRSRDSTVEDQPDNEDPPATLPVSGVYTYASSGTETVKLGVLPAENRGYPDTMSVVIVDNRPSCFTVTLNLIDQHTERTAYCLDGAGRLRIDSHSKQQQIGALTPSAAMTCDPAVLVAPTANEQDLGCTLSLSGGPVRADHWLPLRIERILDLHGPATFTEQSTLDLTDLEPVR